MKRRAIQPLRPTTANLCMKSLYLNIPVPESEETLSKHAYGAMRVYSISGQKLFKSSFVSPLTFAVAYSV